MDNDLAYFLGLWVAEGSFEENVGRITITCSDRDVGELLESGKILGQKFKNGRSSDDICSQWRTNSYELMELMRFLKMPLVEASEKWIPDFVWSGKRECAEHFVSGMFDGDGYIRAGRNKAGYTTASKRLALDLQLLLTNFGVISRITAVESRPTDKVKVCSMQYKVEVHGNSLCVLKDVLHLRIKRKAGKLRARSTSCLSRRDSVPILSMLEGLKLNIKGIKRKRLYDALVASRRGSDTTYEKIELILKESTDLSATTEYKKLEKIMSDHYYWDEIVEITPSESMTYDFTIPDTHSFWSNGFISHNSPKGYNYFYDIYLLGQDEERVRAGQWKSWQFPTIVSPFIPKEEIEAARQDMDEKSFQQEFLASFTNMAGKVYYPFERGIHVRSCPFNPDLPIWVGQDFNIDPMSAVIMQPQNDGTVWIVSEIVKFSSNTEESVDEIERRYYRYRSNVTIFPDPAGNSRQHARGETDLDIFRERGFKRIKHRRKHPAIADRVNCVNRMLRAADGSVRLFIDPSCKSVIESFNQTTYKAGTRDVDKAMNVEHSTDAAGYCLELQFPMRKIEIVGISI